MSASALRYVPAPDRNAAVRERIVALGRGDIPIGGGTSTCPCRLAAVADIFLGYAREDKSRAKHVAGALEQQGWSVFWDYKIAAGANWGDLLDKELNAAKCVVVLWSTNAVTSRWVKTEARRGIERDVLVPATLDVCEIPVEFRYHHSADLSAWNGDAADHELQVLFDGVRSICAVAPSATAKEPRSQESSKKKALRFLDLYIGRNGGRRPAGTLLTSTLNWLGVVVLFGVVVWVVLTSSAAKPLWQWLTLDEPTTVAEQVQTPQSDSTSPSEPQAAARRQFLRWRSNIDPTQTSVDPGIGGVQIEDDKGIVTERIRMDRFFDEIESKVFPLVSRLPSGSKMATRPSASGQPNSILEIRDSSGKYVAHFWVLDPLNDYKTDGLGTNWIQ